MGLNYAAAFHGNMAAALGRAEWTNELPKRARRARRAGRLRGYGMRQNIEAPVGRGPMSVSCFTSIPTAGGDDLRDAIEATGTRDRVRARSQPIYSDVPSEEGKLVTGDRPGGREGRGLNIRRAPCG